jgi:hypothetical protein
MAEARRLFDAVPVPGGAHPGLGTRNALLGLADGHYLEIIAPDPAQPLAGTFGAALADLSRPALITWALRSHDLPGIARRLTGAGLQTRGPVRTRRTTPAGDVLEWDLLFVSGHAFGTLLPFFIDWRDTPHPAGDLTAVGTLEAITLETPHASELRRLLGHLDVPVAVKQAVEPALRATLTCPHGEVVLESLPATLALRFG